MESRLDPHCILRVENNSGLPINIRRIFSGVGEIPQLYLADNGVPGQFHCFVEYQRRESADDALRLQLGNSAGLQVYSGATNTSVMEQFYSYTRQRFSRRVPDNRYVTPSSRNHQSGYSSSHPRQTWSGSLQEGRRSDLAMLKPPPSLALDVFYSSRTLSPRSRSCPAPRIDSVSDSSHTSSADESLTKGIHAHPTQGKPAPYSLETRLIMNIRGQQIVYDLAQDSGQDPSSVIEILKLSLSERANWMTAGAHFRRIGKPQTAIEIMRAMLEVMLQHGYKDAKLAPVYLLLAGCEWDLAISARTTGDIPTYERHHTNAKTLLGRVFGTDSPTLQTPLPNALLSSRLKFKRETTSPSHPPAVDMGGRSYRYNSQSSASRKRRLDNNSSRDREVLGRRPRKKTRRSMD